MNGCGSILPDQREGDIDLGGTAVFWAGLRANSEYNVQTSVRAVCSLMDRARIFKFTSTVGPRLQLQSPDGRPYLSSVALV